MRKTTHAETVFKYQCKLADGQFVLEHVASDITVHETNLHFMRNHQVFHIQLVMKCSHRPTRILGNVVSAKVKWGGQHADKSAALGH